MKKDFRGLRSVLIVFFMALVVIGVYYRFSNKPVINSEEKQGGKPSHVEEVLSRNLKTDYPQSPKEVVKYFSEITQCYYNETFKENDENVVALANKMLELYDEELTSYKAYPDYLFDLKSDIKFYNENGFKISSYKPSASTDVIYFEEDGYEWARLWCVYTIKSSTDQKKVNEVFVLRKDKDSHWKIYGWKEDTENG